MAFTYPSSPLFSRTKNWGCSIPLYEMIYYLHIAYVCMPFCVILIISWLFVIPSFQFSSVAQYYLTLCDPMNHSMPGLPVYHQLPESTKTHVHWVGDAIQPSHPLSYPSPPALNLSQHQDLFKWVSSSYQVAKVLEFQLKHQSFQWTQDWSPLGWTGWISLQSKGCSSLLQHHSSKASILLHSGFFIVQLSHPYMTTGKKNIALTRWTFVDKGISLLFNTLSRLVLTFLPRSKCLLNSCLQSPSAVILESHKIKSAIVSTISRSISHEVVGPDALS